MYFLFTYIFFFSMNISVYFSKIIRIPICIFKINASLSFFVWSDFRCEIASISMFPWPVVLFPLTQVRPGTVEPKQFKEGRLSSIPPHETLLG